MVAEVGVHDAWVNKWRVNRTFVLLITLGTGTTKRNTAKSRAWCTGGRILSLALSGMYFRHIPYLGDPQFVNNNCVLIFAYC